MIVYHGTPFGGEREGVARFLAGRHALIPFLRPEDLGVALEVCQTIVLDNSAYTAWRKGKPITDWEPYYDMVRSVKYHPRFQWAIIPDIIDGSEAENDQLWGEWPGDIPGIPVWHLHESMDRLKRMIHCHRSHICIGSSGEYSQPASKKWFAKMEEAFDVICDESGSPKAKIHGLRMANPKIIERYPFSSVDSTNAARNSNLSKRYGYYPAPTRWQRAQTLAQRMEACVSPGIWSRPAVDVTRPAKTDHGFLFD